MIKNSIPHILSVTLFAVLSMAYFYPLLSGKAIVQSDIQQFQGMQRQVVEHRADYDEEPYWADNAFGGMPTYQITSSYPSDFIGKVENIKSDFNKVCKHLNANKIVNLPVLRKTNHRKPQDYYTNETIEIISKLYERDFKEFQYNTSIQ